VVMPQVTPLKCVMAEHVTEDWKMEPGHHLARSLPAMGIRRVAVTENKTKIISKPMKKIMFALLVLLNFSAIYYGALRFFVTFADVPTELTVPLAELRHLHHKGMEDMRDFLWPGLAWLAGTMLTNLAVAGIAIFGRKRN
jgi:hypothetical protein